MCSAGRLHVPCSDSEGVLAVLPPSPGAVPKGDTAGTGRVGGSSRELGHFGVFQSQGMAQSSSVLSDS